MMKTENSAVINSAVLKKIFEISKNIDFFEIFEKVEISNFLKFLKFLKIPKIHALGYT